MILSTHGVIASQIQSFVGLLDLYPSAAAAYSVRKLRAAYTGSAIRVRRSSDNTEQDIGFSGENLDTTSLTSFCSGTNGFVTTWYDQSGNGRNGTQTTAANQPQIVSSGAVLLLNSKPALSFDGTNDKMTFTYQWANSTFDLFGISRVTKVGYQAIIAEGNGSNGYLGLGYTLINVRFAFFNTGLADRQFAQTYAINTQYLGNYYGSGISAGSSNVLFRVNNGTQSSGTLTTGNTNSSSVIGAGGTGDFLSGNLQEMILYPSDKTATRTGIATNINDYYAIY
jgi:hypothetical protein